MGILGVLSLAGLVALVSSSSAASSQETSTNCMTTDGSVGLPSANDDESAYNKPKEEQLRSSRLTSDRRFDSYSGGDRRYELPRRLDERNDHQNEDVQGHASSRHLDHDRRFLMGASGDYFSREQSRSGQRHSTSRYPDDDYSSNDRRDYVNGKDMLEHMPRHYLDEERNLGKNGGRDDQENKERDRFSEIHVEDVRRNNERENNGRDHPINRFDDDYVSKSSVATKQKNEWEHPTDRSKDEDYVFGSNRERDRDKIDRENNEKIHLKAHVNEDYISKVNNERDRTNVNDERNRFDVDHISQPYDKSQDMNAQNRVPSRYLDVEKSKNYHDQTFMSDLENKNSDKNLNIHSSKTNLNGDSKDEISDVIDKSLAVLPLGQDTTTDRHTIDDKKDKDVDHVTFIERDENHDIRIEDSHPVKSLMDHKIADPIDYHHLHDAQFGPDDDQNSKRHYKDPYVDRYSNTNFDKDPYHSPDRILKGERHIKSGPSSDYHEMVSSDKDDSYPERLTSDASTSKLTPRDHHDKLHSDQQDFSSHSNLLPERRLGTNIHDDAHFSDENYDRKVLGHPSNRYKQDDLHTIPRVKDINNDKYADEKSIEDYTTTGPRKESNISHLMTFTVSRDWDDNRPKLIFPNKTGIERYRMATLHLDKGLFVFDFLRYFLSFIQPKDVPLDILKDTIEGKIRVPTLIGQTIYLEVVFIAVIVIMVILMLILPSTEFWLCCRPARYNYRRKRRRPMTCFLALYTVIIIICAVTMLVCNEEMNIGIKTIPKTVEAVIQDLRDYHEGNAGQLRKCLTRSLDVASEAILADLDNVEELLGKPVQAQLSQETGVDIALDALMDVANSSQELAYKTDGLLKRAERAREFAAELGRETDDIRHDLERAQRDCSHEDRSLCAVLDPTGLHLALRLDRVARDDRLLRLRAASRDNLTELGRQARGEYLYVPHHVGRNSLEARNLIRREVNTARAKVSDEARSIEASGSDMTNQLDSVRELSDRVLPYVNTFERTRWQIGFSTAMCVLFVWLLLFGAVCCRCGCSEGRVRPTLLWFVFFSTFLSMALWLIVVASLTIASHAEMLLCRPLDDPEFRAVEAILETRTFLGKRLSVPLKDLFEKCEENNAAYPAYQLDNSARLEQLTSHWTWNGLTRAFSRLRVDLTGLRVLSPNLRERLQNLLYACGPNLTEHRVMIQGPILNKDLNALSDQVENVARQLTDRRTARTFQTIAAQMRDLLSRRVKPLMKMQDELVYHLATLELHLLPLQQKVNQTMSQLRNVQYFIDNQGDKIAQLKTKAFMDRLGGYLDEWRAHVLTEMSAGVSKCRPLWDILQGIKLLICSHILGPLNGFWFAAFICAMTLLICTPSAHSVASGYHRTKTSSRGSVLLPSRQGSQETVVMERETWRTPPPPSVDSW